MSARYQVVPYTENGRKFRMLHQYSDKRMGRFDLGHKRLGKVLGIYRNMGPRGTMHIVYEAATGRRRSVWPKKGQVEVLTR